MSRCIAIIICILLYGSSVRGQVFARKAEEPAKDFAMRCKPVGMEMNDALEKQIIATTEWTNNEAIIAFYTVMVPNDYDHSDHEKYLEIVGYMYVPVSAGNYERVLIDTFETEGGDPEIASVFFANADKDSKRELVVLCKWPQHHYQVYGNFFNTRIYDNIDVKKIPARLTLLKKVSDKVDGGFDGEREGETVHARYTTAKEIRAGLAALGY